MPSICCSYSVAKSCPTLWPYGLQHASLLCPPLSPRVCSDSCALSQWCCLTISSSAPPSSFAFNLSQHQGLFQWVGSLHHVIKHLGSANYTTLSNDLLSSKLENFTYKGPGSKYFRLGGPWQSVGTIRVDRYSPEAAIDDGRACAPITFYLWMLKFKFHIIFTRYKILSSVDFFPNHLKMWKPFLADGPYKNKWWAEFGLGSIIHQPLL